MKFFVSVVMWFLFLNYFTTAQTLIRDSCKTAAAEEPNLYDFCVHSLEQDPQSKTATNLTGLFIASTNNAASKTTHVKGIVETILKNKNKKYPPAIESALSTCVELYDDANDSLNEALMNVKSGHYRNANIDLSAALDAPTTCEDGFTDGFEKATSPVTNENNVLYQKIWIPLAFTNML